MNRTNLTLWFLILSSVVYAQQGNIIIEGQILADSLEGAKINIVNISQEIGTTNSELGAFKIEVHENDTLLFSSVQFEEVIVRVSEEHITQKYIEVILIKSVIDLNEVNLSNISLTGDLARDTEGINTYNYYEGIPTSKLPRLTSIGRKLYTARDGDIDPLLNYLSGRMQMLEKAIENEQLTFDVQKGIDALEFAFFTQELQIPEEEIINFVYYCAASPSYQELIQNNNYLGVIELFKEKVSEFKDLKKTETLID